MSEEARKACRTQGKYREQSQYFEDKRSQKRQERLQGSSTVKEPQEKKYHKRKSNGGKASNTSLTSESESPVRYEENSVRSFSEFEKGKKPEEIKISGKHILSTTENGESVVLYDAHFFEEDEAFHLKKLLKNSTNWSKKNIIIHGAEVPQPRLVAWYGPFPYTYSGATLEPAEMPDSILQIKEKVEDFLKRNGINVTLNSVLLNLYRNNKDSVAWHSDDEMSMGVCPTIASVSLGATRKFEMKRKLKQPVDGSPLGKGDEYFMNLTNGSLLIMDGCMQLDWLHRVPKEYHDRCERINLTFRTVFRVEGLPRSPDTYPKRQHWNNNGVVRKSFGNKTECGVNYDEENFPPLGSNASPVCSGVKKSPESSVPMEVKTSGELNKWRSNGSFYSNKASLKNSSEINETVDTEQSPGNCSYVKKSPESSVPMGVKTSGEMNKWRSNGSFYSSKASLKNSTEITKSNETVDTEQSPGNKTCWKTDKVSASELPYNKISSNTPDKIVVPGDVHDDAAIDTKVSMKTDDISDESEEYWDSESSPTSNNFVIKDVTINRSGKQVMEPSYGENGIISNNLNEDKKYVKMDMQNKNLHAYDSHFSSNVQSARANARRDRNFHTRGSYNTPTHCVDNMQDNAHNVKNETTFGRDGSWTPNVEAKEFVPCSAPSGTNIPYDYTAFDLESLLGYKGYLMNGAQLKYYALALRDKVVMKLNDFVPSYREQLEFQCSLIEEDQTEKYLKLILHRMDIVVSKALTHGMSPNYRKSYGGNPRRPNHGNQNYFQWRMHPTHSREGSFEH